MSSRSTQHPGGRRRRWQLILAGALLLVPASATSQSNRAGDYEGDYLYRVTMYRAAPGHYAEFLSALEESVALGQEGGDGAPFWIRHSQGDQWDFMVIYPMGDPGSYYGETRSASRAAIWGTARGLQVRERLQTLSAYTEDWFARSVDAEEMTRRFDGMGLFHVEMFAGLPEMREELFEQRRMENRYYEQLSRQQNLLFVREAGSNWDAMTIGFYENLQAYAAAGVRYTDAQQNEAALAAGFDGVGAISPYLRSLLSYHHDTLGVPVR